MNDNSAAKSNYSTKPQLLGFSFCNASSNVWLIFVLYFFMVYCTEVYKFSPMVAGLIMTGTRLFDAVTDPVIGLLIDKTDTKIGRFRPWIIGAMILGNLGFIGIFSGIRFGSTTLDIIFVSTVYCLWILGYTFQNTVTKAAQCIMTNKPKQRTMINAFGAVWAYPIIIFITSYTITLVQKFGGDIANPAGWRMVALIIVIINIILSSFVIIGMWKKDVPENYLNTSSGAELPKFKDYVGIIKSNQVLRMLIVAASTNKLASTIRSGLAVVFFFYVAGSLELQKEVQPATMIIAFFGLILAVIITNKLGRKKTFTISSWGAMIWGVIAIFLIPINPSSALWLILILGIDGIIASGAQDVNIISMVGDATDYELWKNGRFIPGMIGTLFSLVDKTISAFSSTINGFVLTMLGFVSITETPASDQLFWGVLLLYFLVPAFGHLCSIIAMKYYPLDNETHRIMLEELDNKKNESGAFAKE